MWIYHAMVLLFLLQGHDCMKFLIQRDTEHCILDYMGNQDVTKKCKILGNNLLAGKSDYHFNQGIVYYTEYQNPIRLKGIPMNFSMGEISSTIGIPFKARYNITDFAVDWVHDTWYIICEKQLKFAPVLVSQEEILLSNVLTVKEVAQVIREDENFIKIESVKLDPYEELMFLSIRYRRTSSDGDQSRTTVVLRSDFKGKGLKIITPLMIVSSFLQFNVDIGEKRLYIFQHPYINMYDYEGQFVNQFYLGDTIGLVSFHMLGQSLYLTSSSIPGIGNITLNITEKYQRDARPKENPKINNQIPHGLSTGLVTFKVLDARVQRSKRNGTYFCDRRDCTELCEVWPSGDTCVCSKTKAKTMDGITCYECGHSNLTSLEVQTTIVNGTDSHLGLLPWHAVLYYTITKGQFCGGTLISPRVVLTAAHCVTHECTTCIPTPIEATDVVVALGKTHRAWDSKEKSQQTRQVVQIITHNRFGGESQKHVNDIALLILDSKVQYNNFVMPACLDYNLNQLPPHETLTGYVAGMGLTEECGTDNNNMCSHSSEVLKYTKVKVLTFANCFKLSNKIESASYHMLTPDKFCIGEGSVSAVQKGDSGGGLTLEYRGLHYLSGVVSTKLVNIEKTKYIFGAFTNVSDHMEWLRHNLPKED